MLVVVFPQLHKCKCAFYLINLYIYVCVYMYSLTYSYINSGLVRQMLHLLKHASSPKYSF
jgi:hypothetical protein